MCGIAGLIHRGGTGSVGTEMTAMLQALKHRGPDSTGFALYGQPGRNEYILRFKVAEQDDLKTGFKIHDQIKQRKTEVDRRLKELGVMVNGVEDATEYAFRYRIQYDGEMKKVVDYIEDVEGAEILSILKAKQAMARADVSLLLIDAVEGVTHQDAVVAGYAQDAGAAVILVENKWDLVPKDTYTVLAFEEKIRHDLGFLNHAPTNLQIPVHIIRRDDSERDARVLS